MLNISEMSELLIFKKENPPKLRTDENILTSISQRHKKLKKTSKRTLKSCVKVMKCSFPQLMASIGCGDGRTQFSVRGRPLRV